MSVAKKSYVVLVFFLMAKMIGLAESQEDCTDQYLPCICGKGLIVECFGIPMDEVRKVFDRTTTPQIAQLILIMNPSDEYIPTDVMGNKTVQNRIALGCPAVNYRLKVDENAFRSSTGYPTEVEIANCDLSLLDLTFLTGFDQLSSLLIYNTSNIDQTFKTLPPLPNLDSLSIIETSGLDLLTEFPFLVRGLGYLYIFSNREFNGVAINRFLKWTLESSADSLHWLSVSGNGLENIPEEITFFNRLDSVVAFGNSLHVIVTGSFNFSFPVFTLILSSSEINEIRPGAFLGDFSHSTIFLDGNNLTKFEEPVFRSTLQQMILDDRAFINLSNNPIDCTEDPCHLAWLFQNPDLLNSVEYGQCSNGTAFSDLDPNAFEDCIIYSSLLTK